MDRVCKALNKKASTPENLQKRKKKRLKAKIEKTKKLDRQATESECGGGYLCVKHDNNIWNDICIQNLRPEQSALFLTNKNYFRK